MRTLCHSKKKATCRADVYDVVWFIKELSKRLDRKVEVNEVGYESIMLTPDEVDEELIPLGETQTLPNPLLAHSFIYVEDEGDEWICVVVTDEFSQFKHYEAWFENSTKIK